MVIFTPGNANCWLYINPDPSAPLYNKDFIIRSLCAAEPTLTPVLYRLLLQARSESGVPELFIHTSVSISPAKKCARWSAVFGDVRFTARTVVNEAPWGRVPKQLSPFQIGWYGWGAQRLSQHCCKEGDKPNWTVGIHSTRSTEKHWKQGMLLEKGFRKTRVPQTRRFLWPNLYLHKLRPMLSVLWSFIPESIRTTVKLRPSQNHRMVEVEVGRNLWRSSNPTFLLRAVSWGRFLETLPSLVLIISKDGNSATSLGNLCLITLSLLQAG